MELILLMIIIVLLIFRVFKLLKLVFSIDFVISFIPAIAFLLSIGSQTYYLALITFFLVIGLKVVEFNDDVVNHANNLFYQKLNKTWNTLSWFAMVSCVITLSILLYLENRGSGFAVEDVLFSLVLGSLYMWYSKLFRIPWLVLANLVFLTFSITHLLSSTDNQSYDSSYNDNSLEGETNISSDNNVDIDQNIFISESGSNDIYNLNNVASDYSLIDNYDFYDFNGSYSDTLTITGDLNQPIRDEVININPFLYSNYLESHNGFILNSSNGIPSLSFENGEIIDLHSNTTIGSYGVDPITNNHNIYDQDNNIILSSDSSGAVYNSKHEIIGINNVGVQGNTFVDVHGNVTTYLDDSGSLFSKDGRLLACINKE